MGTENSLGALVRLCQERVIPSLAFWPVCRKSVVSLCFPLLLLSGCLSYQTIEGNLYLSANCLLVSLASLSLGFSAFLFRLSRNSVFG